MVNLQDVIINATAALQSVSAGYDNVVDQAEDAPKTSRTASNHRQQLAASHAGQKLRSRATIDSISGELLSCQPAMTV